MSQQPTPIKAFQNIRLGYDQVAKITKAVDFWRDVHPQQARLVVAYIVEAFAANGLDMRTIQPGDVFPTANLQFLDKYKELVSRLHHILHEQGNLLTLSPNTIGEYTRTHVPVDPTPAETIYQDLIGLYPQHDVVHQLVRAVGPNLAGCLSGSIDGLHLIFGSAANKKLLNSMYEFWPLLRTPTVLLGDFIVSAATAASESGGKPPFRILEVGAGTGGTTRHVIQRLGGLAGVDFEYVFSDISTSLLATAKRQFKKLPGGESMSFEVVDVEKPPKQEHEGRFDCIISTNCIHATKDLDKTLRHLQAMLTTSPAGGALMLVEVTQRLAWLDMVFGLFDGWWLFDDGRTHALIDEGDWAGRMMNAGFDKVFWTEGEAPEARTVRLIGAFTDGSSTL